MRGNKMTQSLKASKQVAHSPSKVEVILTDSQKLTVAPIVSLFNTSYELGLKLEGLSLSKGEAEQQAAHGFVSYVKDNQLDYANYQAFKKHVIGSLSAAKKQSYETIEKWLNKIVKAYIADDSTGYQLPKAESKAAKGMSELRAALASLSDDELKAQIEASAKAEDFKKASQLSAEKIKRDTQKANAIKKAESKHTTEKKSEIKAWVTNMDLEGLAALLYVKNHFTEIKKLAKVTK
jgi:hypothetical protein